MGQTGGEKLIWNMLLPEDRQYFAEFIEDGQVENAPRTLYTIQRRIHGGVRCSEWAGPEYNKMHDLYTRYAITADFGLCQFFIVKGEPIAHDYGYLNDRSLVSEGYPTYDSAERIYSRSSRNAEYATHSEALGEMP
jgi:hypothetical protein